MEDAVAAESIVQGTPEWHAFRLGKITVSEFGVLLAEPKSTADRAKGKLAKTAEAYLYKLVAEHLTGESQDAPPNWAMQWGTDCEPAARQVYSELTGLEVEEVGFVQHPQEPMIGGSPDGLIGDDGGVEIKCPGNTANHIAYMVGGELPKEHGPQVYGHIWLNDREWWDFVSYDPRIKGPGSLGLALWRHRVYRDEEYIRNLERKVFAFRDVLLETLIALKTGGRL